MKQFYITVILVFCLQFGFGQVGFYKKNIADSELGIEKPNSLFVTDLDGDGNMDVIAASSTDYKIVWYKNIDDQGNYGLQQVIATVLYTTNVTDIIGADIDGDGDIDVLSSSTGNNKIAWYENTDGLGNFGYQEIISSTTNNVISIDAVDIDGDGDLDILSKERYYLLWYENMDGLGSFGESNIITSIDVNYSESLATADIDNDGDLDIVSNSSLGSDISWYENTNGLGDFNEHVLSNTSFSSMQVADIDNDGDIDILASNFSSIHLFKNLDGLGNFENTQVDYLGSGVGEIYLSDFDEDGLVDIFLEKANRVAWYKNIDGLGDFGEHQFVTSTEDFATELFVSDVDNDGDKDVLFVSSRDDKVGWYNNTNEQEVFWEFTPISFSYYDGGNEASLADLDGDGDLDILIAGPELSWYENLDGQSSFGYKQYVYISYQYISASSYFAETVDIDGDGDLDILSLTSQQGSIVWYENLDGQGNFGGAQSIDDINSITSNVRSADFDGDGDLDVVCGSWGNANIAWYENMDGLGNFGERQVIYGAIFTNYCLPVDIDGDGDMDIVAARNTNFILFENLDGQGNFGDSQTIVSDLLTVKNILAEDLDNDGDMDILFSTNTGGFQIPGSISWLENLNGQGNFGEQQDIITFLSIEDSFDLADMDNDGDLDIITNGSDSSVNQMGWFENIDGQGNFDETRIVIDPINSTTFVKAADIDDDGDVDVISGRSGKLSIYEKLGVLGNEFNGIVQLDLNSEGCNNETHVLSNIQITSDNGSQSFSTFTIQNSSYQLPVSEGEFTTSVTSQFLNYYTTNPLLYSTSVEGTGNVESMDFCITPSGIFNDLQISIYPSQNNPRPGFSTTYHLLYNNIGTTQLNGSVTFEFDNSKLNFLNASETITSQTANTLTFDFTGLNPFETRTIDLEFNVFAPPTTNIGDVLVTTATVNPVSGDETEEDNVFTLEQTVIGSYDPNDITVLEGDEITIDEADKYLHYLIRFQNTGTASAINVRVDHILDNKLDWTTMQLESLSHTGRVEITDETDVSFIFNNINLADSTNDEPNSHGYIAYKIKPKSDIEVGDIISGTADIFFDFNPAIITNTVSTEIVESLSVDQFNAQAIQVFPNPAKDKLEITSSQIIDNLKIIDINGRLLKDIKLSNLEYSLDVSNLTKGVYFLEIQSGESKSTKKFVKN